MIGIGSLQSVDLLTILRWARARNPDVVEVSIINGLYYQRTEEHGVTPLIIQGGKPQPQPLTASAG